MPTAATHAENAWMHFAGELPPEALIFGHSEIMQSLRERLVRVASANVPVLIQGESGTGKDIVARLIHGFSPWRTGPFLKVNCPAIPATLLEAELFGYEKGAFTGAVARKGGRVELAHRGTLFFDEVLELDIAAQSKLLQFLQDGRFCRIGAQEDRQVSARVICATNRNVKAEIALGNFRHDLYYRINVVNLRMPSLRERRRDIPDLATYFRQYYNHKYNRSAPGFSPEAMTTMTKYHWPGNIRELENLIKRYVILGDQDELTSSVASSEPQYFASDINFDGPISLKQLTRRAVRELERTVILKTLQANHWNRKRTASALSLSYRALLYKISDAGLQRTRS